jgi:AcrR family transcriptional regulator
MSTIVRKKPGEWHHRDLRHALLTAAAQVIEKGGVESLTMRALAARTGVSSGAPYHHFRNRDALLAALAGEGFRRLCEAMELEALGTAGPLARLAGLGRGYIRFAQAHPGYFRVMFLEAVKRERDATLEREGTRALALLREAIGDCQKTGKAPAGDPLPWVLLAWSAVHGAANLSVDGSLRFDNSLSQPRAERAVTGSLGALLRLAATHEVPGAQRRPRRSRRKRRRVR